MNTFKRGIAFVALGVSTFIPQDRPIPSSFLEKEFLEQTEESLVDLLAMREKKHRLKTTPHLIFELSALKNTPFDPQKKMLQGKLGDLLGYSQVEEIIKEFNDFPDSLKVSAQQNYDLEQDILTIPLIYPELLDYFPQDLEDLLQSPAFEKYSEESNPHLLVVSQCENGKNALAYYQKGTLTLASYVSIGTGRSTLSGKYPLKHDAIFRRSRKYQNAAMPYSLHFIWWYFVHQGLSDGNPRSKWCIRMPGLYQKRLYEQLPNPEKDSDLSSAEIILEGLYQPTLKKLDPERAEK